MKKILALVLALTLVFALAACSKDNGSAGNDAADTDVKGEGVMTYDEFMAAEEGSSVTVEAYVLDHQSWWDDKVTVYAQDDDGGYFFYDMACSEADAAKLTPGTKIKVTGDKSVWSGEIEITDATFEFEDGSKTFSPVAIDDKLGTDELEQYMNMYVSVSGAKIADKGDGAAFFYNWDNSGEDGGSDLYFDIEVNGGTYTFVVRRYLTPGGSDVYEAVKNLQVGDTVDIEGYLYWYEGPQPHITSITVK